MAKAALKCAGKYVRGSVIEDAFIETQIFGPTTLESVLNISHHYRSLSEVIIIDR